METSANFLSISPTLVLYFYTDNVDHGPGRLFPRERRKRDGSVQAFLPSSPSASEESLTDCFTLQDWTCCTSSQRSTFMGFARRRGLVSS